MDDLAEFAAQYWLLIIVGLFLVGFSANFLLCFVRGALRLSGELEISIVALRKHTKRADGNVIDLNEIATQAMAGPALSRLWLEYVKTLHPERKDDERGQSRIVRWRATALAETFFTDQAVVDTRLRTEFYKHMPGILTGLGIIGTFTGLIKGLRQFNVSDPTRAQEQLGKLVSSVGDAFFVSACAIGLAMLFTVFEKALVASRYRQVEEIRELIDSLFESGAGEEYLERLVVASETSATQSAHIKDALVADLKDILTSLTAQQIEAQSRQTGQISVDVGRQSPTI